jgi:hypothetical protein
MDHVPCLAARTHIQRLASELFNLWDGPTGAAVADDVAARHAQGSAARLAENPDCII